jgi:hypothetical protein
MRTTYIANEMQDRQLKSAEAVKIGGNGGGLDGLMDRDSQLAEVQVL